MAYSSSERRNIHRSGYSVDTQRRRDGAGLARLVDAGESRIFASMLPMTGTPAVTVSGVAYWVYVGRLTSATTLANVELVVTTGGSGAQTAELALASSVTPPNRAAKAITVLATQAPGDLTGTGVIRGSSAFNYSVREKDVGLYLWAGIRTAMATTQPTTSGHTLDCSDGQILSTAAAGVLAVGTTYTGALITHSASAWQAPMLRVTLD